MNSMTMTATLTRDPKLEQHEGTTVCEMRVADRKRLGKPFFINVTAFGKEAERCARYLKKGRHVALAGYLRFHEWKTEKGEGRSEHSMVANQVEFLPSAAQSDRAEGKEDAPASGSPWPDMRGSGLALPRG